MEIVAPSPSLQTLKALETVPDAYLVLSPELLVLTASNAFLQVTATRRNNIKGKPLSCIFPYAPESGQPLFLPRLEAALQQVVLSRKPLRMPLQPCRLPDPTAPTGFTEKHWLPHLTPVMQGENSLHYLIVKLEEAPSTATAQANSKYLSLFNSIDQGFCIIKLYFDAQQHPTDFRYLEVNPAFAKQTSLLDADGKLVRELLPNIEASWLHKYGQVALKGEPIRFVDQVEDLDKWFEVYAFRVSAPEEHQVAVLFKDITEARKAEELLANHNALLEEQVAERTRALQESEQLLSSVLENTSSSIMVLKTVRQENGEITDFEYVLTNSNQLKSVRQEAVVGRKLSEGYPEMLSPQLTYQFREVVNTGQEWTGEVQGKLNGQEHWSQVCARKFGEGLLVTYVDITQLKKAEQELRESTNFTEQVMDATPDFIMVFNLQTNKVDFVNRSAYHDNEERFLETLAIDYHCLLDRAHPDDRKPLHDFIGQFRTATTSQVHSLEYRVQEAGETIWYRSRGKVFKRDADGTPTHYISVVQDISALKHLEEENVRIRLEQQKALLLTILQAQEEERRRISEGLHNSVGQLLYAAKLHLHLLQGPGTGSDAALQQVDKMLEQAINETRALSHALTPAVLAQFGLEAAFREIGNAFSSNTLKLHCQVDNLPHTLEKNLQIVLYRIAQELAINIIKHAAATSATLSLRTSNHTLVLKAEDNGKGFNPAALPAKGIGLSSIQDRVNLLNGNCTLTAAPGKGTIVEIRLPLPPGP